jgi:preprotein translocase subunit SecG
MQAVVLTIHLLVCICLIGLVLLQRSEGGALGMGGGNSGALMSGRGAADALARMTQIAGLAFLITSLSLTVLSGSASSASQSVFDLIPHQERVAPVVPAPTPTPTPAQPARPDPTQSSAPQAAQTQLASTSPGPVAAATPAVVAPTTTAGAHAAPLQSAAVTAAPLPAANRQHTTTPASAATSTAAPAHAQATTQHSASTTTQASTSPATHPLVLPTSRSAAALTDNQNTAESGDASTGLQPVRRERAGPDQ